MTIGDIISRIRTVNKLQNADARISDRVIYNQMLTSRDVFLKNEDDKKALLKMYFLFKPLNRVDLMEIDTIEACGIDSDCLVMRSVEKLPTIIKAGFGHLIRHVTSLDGKIDLSQTTRRGFNRKVGQNEFKYDHTIYYFIEDEYVYLCNADWEAIRVVAFFEDPAKIDELNACYDDESVVCTPMKEREFLCPNHLVGRIIEVVGAELLRNYNGIREDMFINKNPNI